METWASAGPAWQCDRKLEVTEIIGQQDLSLHECVVVLKGL
jgi:hypothetical protein